MNRYPSILKTGWFLLILILCAGCADDNLLPEEETTFSTRSGKGNGVPDYLDRTIGVGWGYDCNTYFGDPRGVTDQIFSAAKIKALAEKYSGELFIEDEPYEVSDSYVCSGENSTEYSEKMALGVSLSVTIPFAFSLDVNARFSQSDMQSGEYYFVTRRQKNILMRRVMGESNILAAVASGEDVFTEGFKYYLDKMTQTNGSESSIREFVNIFGNTYVTTSEVGGRLDLDMSVKKDSSFSMKEVEVSVQAKMLSMFSLSVSETQQQAVTKTSSYSKTSVSAKGGDVTLLGKALLNGAQCDSLTLVNWQNSIDTVNSQMVGCSLNPIWELISNQSVAERVKAYIQGSRVDEVGYSYPQQTASHFRFTVPQFNDNGTLVKVAWANGRALVEFCQEVASRYGLTRRVVMAYPIVDYVPDYTKGICVEDKAAVYLDGTTLSTKASSDYTYTDGGQANEVWLSYLNKDYRLVKIANHVWTRDNYATVTDYKGNVMTTGSSPYNYDLSNGFVLLNPDQSAAFNADYLPYNWRLPSADDVNDLKSLFNTCDPFFSGGSSGLDLTFLGYNDAGGYQDTSVRGKSYLIVDTGDNCLICFTKMEALQLVKMFGLVPVRLVRDSGFRYK